MINYILYHLAPIWAGIGCWEIGKWYLRRRKLPYRWKCPKCSFSLSTNVRETYEISKSSHNHLSTEEYK